MYSNWDTNLLSFVTKKVDLFETIFLNKLKTESFVPTFRYYIYTDLAANYITQSQSWKFFIQSINKLLPDVMFLKKKKKKKRNLDMDSKQKTNISSDQGARDHIGKNLAVTKHHDNTYSILDQHILHHQYWPFFINKYGKPYLSNFFFIDIITVC